MGSHLLESFDAAPPKAREDLAFEKGHAAGHAAALAEMQDRQAAISSELVQHLKDMEFTFVEARAEITHALAPLFRSIADTLVPELAAQGFALRVATLLEQAAQENLGAQMTIAVNPVNLATLQGAAADIGTFARIRADSGLTPHSIHVGYADGGVIYDFDSLVVEIRGILDAFANSPERKQNHG